MELILLFSGGGYEQLHRYLKKTATLMESLRPWYTDEEDVNGGAETTGFREIKAQYLVFILGGRCTDLRICLGGPWTYLVALNSASSTIAYAQQLSCFSCCYVLILPANKTFVTRHSITKHLVSQFFRRLYQFPLPVSTS